MANWPALGSTIPCPAFGDVGTRTALDRRWVGVEAVGAGDGLFQAELALDPLRAPNLVGLDQGHHESAPAGPGGAPRAVQVCLLVLRRVKVDDRRHTLHVDPPSGDVGRHQGLGPGRW